MHVVGPRMLRLSLLARSIAIVTCCLTGGLPLYAQTTHTVNQIGETFVPADITVQPRDTVQWIWSSGFHTVTSGTPCTADGIFFDEFHTTDNQLITFVIPDDGTTLIPYFCIPHCGIGMTGTITIEAPPLPCGGDDCDDGVDCTDDSCNETTDMCDNVANNANCDNGLFCDGLETCDPVLDCQAGTAVNCDDGVGCTGDLCNEVSDSCDNVASNLNCNDGLFCNGEETCSATLDCQPGSNPCPGQLCDEAGDLCADCIGNGDCDDGLFCNGLELCDGGVCGVSPGDPCTSQGLTCDEAANQCQSSGSPPGGGGGGGSDQEEDEAPPTETATGEVDAAGALLFEVESGDASTKVVFKVSNGAPGAEVIVSLVTNEGAPGVGDAATFDGFEEDLALGITVEATSPLEAGEFSVLIEVTVPQSGLNALGVEPEELDLHIFDEVASEWVPASSNFVGTDPIELVGDYGYQFNGDGSFTYAALRDALSVFSVGKSTDREVPAPMEEPEPEPEPEPQPEPPLEPEPEPETPSEPEPQPLPEDEEDMPTTPPAPMASPACGGGGSPCGALGLITLSLMFIGLASMRRCMVHSLRHGGRR